MKRESYNKLLKNWMFMLFFSGTTVSMFGENLNSIALMLYVYSFSGSAFDVGFYMLFSTLPKIFIMPFAGILTDRFSKKKLVIAAEIGKAILVTFLPFCKNVSQIYLLVFLMSAFSAFAFPARQAFYPQLIEKQDLMPANSLLSMVSSVVTLIGFAAGGAIVGFFSAKYAFLLYSFTLLLSALSITLIKGNYVKNDKEAKISLREIIDKMKQGLLYCKKNTVLKFAVTFIFIICLLSSMVDPMIVSYTKESLHASEVSVLNEQKEAATEEEQIVIKRQLEEISKKSDLEYSILFILVAVGGLIGAYINGKYLKNISRLKGLLLTTALDGLSLLGIGLFPYFLAAAVFFIIWGIAGKMFQIYLYTLIQEATEQPHMGKVFGLVGLIRDPTTAISYVLGGVFADWTSATFVISVVGVVEMLVCVILALSSLYKKAIGCEFQTREKALVAEG